MERLDTTHAGFPRDRLASRYSDDGSFLDVSQQRIDLIVHYDDSLWRA